MPDAGPAAPTVRPSIFATPTGGGRMSSQNFQLVLTVGQQPGGNRTAASTNFSLRTGFVGAASD